MDPKIVALWGQIGVTTLSQLMFAGCLVTSFFLQDTNLLLLVVGAAIANATTTINYWCGSSSGSQKKDDALILNARRETEPVAIAINNPKE